MEAEIVTNRFYLRRLTTSDATATYLGWLNVESNPFIEASVKPPTIPELKNYIAERIERDDVLFLGIFDKNGDIHVGNLKFEPINFSDKSAVLGILIGDKRYLKRGTGTEVILESVRFLQNNFGINAIHLGVSLGNKVAMSAYEKLGFRQCESTLVTPSQGSVSMIWNLDMPS